ncbi:hypothetical protein E6C27_scaffold213G00490 [Cucumis melo var. makuwa]|uniref:Aminotransferase-like plant mobile domain-containing protein n=1 Tax=Cucumis melo var. makuwa TaxID=1194695 RepID=A0A5A7T019_CUCMM|nr:hypothetical protein E6C27_scaffold213G00490 [Cucumis melo var. makuwa]
MQLYHDALLIPRRLGTMVYFTERFLSGVRHLKPWAGAFADHWPRLDNNSVLPRLSVEVPLFEGKSAWVLQSSIHNEAPNSSRALTLGQRLIEGQTRWGTVTKVPGEFCFTDCYWEWLELVVGRNTRLLYSTRLYGAVTASLYTYDRNSDVVRAFCEAWCPSTNILHTVAGELSISLWDLWSFGGLPIKGDFYEERIPSFKELTSTSRDKTKCLPTTCQYLFQAYYSIPTKRKQKKASRSKSTQNPDGSKIQAREWSSRESMLFAELGIKDDLKDETYLAAFLSCWLCLFVFPQKGSFLRLGVFRVASLMAVGTIYSLAVPVLANIYHGLGLITKASNLIGRMDFYFSMHYVHGWLAHYFGTHYPLPTEVRGPKMTNFSGEGESIYFGEYEARELIHNGARIQWHANIQNRSKHERMVDTHDSSFLQMSYFDLPNDIGGMPPAITLDNILYHWRICMRRNTLSELYLPARSLEPCKHVTQRFTDWWTTKHGTYFEDNRHHLVSSAIPPPSQPRLLKNRGSNLGGKEIRLVEAMAPNLEEEVKVRKDESDSNKCDRYWKRPLKKAKVSGDYPDGRGLSALEVLDVPPLSPLNDHLEGLIGPDSDESLTGPHAVDSAFEEVGTSKTPVNKPTEQSLRPSSFLEEIRRGKMRVGGKDLERHSSKEGVCPKASLQKVSSAHAPLKFSELPLGASNKQTTRNPEPSQWVGEKVVSNFFQKTALCMWEDIQDKIMRTPFEYIPRLRPEIATVLSGIEKIHADGLTSLLRLLPTDKARQLNEKTSAIKEALTLVKQLRGDAKVIQERTAELSLERKELEKRLRSINAESEQLSILSCEKAEAINQQELEVAKFQDEVNTLESTPAITEEAIEALTTVCQSMEAAREEFKNFKWRL